MKIKKGDNVIVIAGKDKGKTGKVTRSFPVRDQVIVEGLNTVTKHQKNRQVRSQGQIIEKSAPIHVSNVALLEGKKAVRLGYKLEGDKKLRISKKTGKSV